MNTITKLVLGTMGRLRPAPAKGSAAPRLELPPPATSGGMPLAEALARRQSARAFATTALPLDLLSNLLWAADGCNRPNGRTAPSALDAQEIDIYVALATGTYLYDPQQHGLDLVAGADLRRVTGYQDFVDEAPLDLIYVADHRRMRLVPVHSREGFAAVAAGAIAQNVYLFAAANGLATVLRAWIDREALAQALGLGFDQHVLLSQTVGFPPKA
jgi:nitroreductase